MPIQSTTRQKVIGLLSLGFAILLANIAVSIWLGQRTAHFSTMTSSGQQLTASLSGLLSAAQDAETGQRGFLLTGEDVYLEPYNSAVERIPRHLQDLQRLGQIHPELAKALPTLTDLITRRLTIIDDSLGHMRDKDPAAAMNVVREGSGKVVMDGLRAEVSRLTADQTTQTATSLSMLQQSEQWSRYVSFIMLATIVGLAFATANIVRGIISELEDAQGELRDVNSGLERIVEERTGEIMRANEEIQRFAYIVSHDLRAPLVNIMGFTSELEAIGKMVNEQYETLVSKAPELLLADTSAAVKTELPEAIGFIRTSTAKMDRLINAILGLSREGRRVLTPVKIDMTGMINDIAKSLHQQLGGSGGEIVVSNLPPLVTDKLAIEQIFSNLIENAVKYVEPERPPRIEVTGTVDGRQTEYTISDNGRGIDSKDLERIFELFRRAGKQDKPGEGLGLAFVRAAVRRLGGSINVASEPGKGSTFKLKFPNTLHVSRRDQNG
jgi:signal transduction histidine kinase